MLIRRLIFVFLALILAGSARAADPNKVEGSYIVDGKTAQLKYAYAVNETCNNKKCPAVLFSAAPISDQDLKTDSVFLQFTDLGRTGKVQALEVIFLADKTISSVRIYDKAFDGALQTGGMETFAATRFDATGITGKITMDGPRSFFDQKFQYNLTFNVNLPAK
jgi:hypothetical protein